MNIPRPISLAAAAASTALGLAAQTDWVLQSPTIRPPMRAWMAVDFDFVRNRSVMTGGFDNVTGNALPDTWEWDGGSWSQVVTTRSPAVDCMDMAYAASTGRVVLFGGLDSAFNWRGETWEYDGSDWTMVSASGPSPRVYMSMTYDIVRDRVVAFGGADRQPFADTWEYDPNARTWAQITTATTPPARAGHGLVFDLRRSVVVMHGGWDGRTRSILTDTWEYDGRDWRQVVTPAAPMPLRTCFGMVYDAFRDRVVLHGGADANFTTNVNDTWEYDGSDWVQLQPVSPGSGLPGLGMVHDLTTGRTFVFGGEDAPTGVDSDDTWELVTLNRPQVARFGGGCSGSAGVPVLALEGQPWIGDTVTLRLSSLPAAPGSAFFLLGFSNTTWAGLGLPVPLDAIGMVGCDVFVSIDVPWSTAHGGSVASVALPIPLTSTPGLRLHVQGLSVDPVATNGIGALSDAGTLTLGAR